MTTKTLAAGLILAVAAAASAPVVARVAQSMPAGPPSPNTLPPCRFDELPAQRAAYDDWPDTILDTAFRLPASYRPPDLVSFEDGRRRIRLRSFVVAELRALLAAARADGIDIALSSGYRSYQDQAAVYQQLVQERGEAQARLYAARPGHSEHHLGTAIDFKGGASWLAHNAWRFGFVQSYPEGRSPEWTCYSAESWHYRYVGADRAEEIRDSGYSPREWLWLHATP